MHNTENISSNSSKYLKWTILPVSMIILNKIKGKQRKYFKIKYKIIQENKKINEKYKNLIK